MSSFWCCATKSRCCAEPIRSLAWTGRIERCSPRWFGVPCQNSMQGLQAGVSLAELGDSLVFVDHSAEDSMASDRGIERAHGC
jgi:hypothetical protein